MTDAVKEIRKDIVRKFCRTILWIDDEIFLDKGLNQCPQLFKTKFEEFSSAGLLCHLMGFPTVVSGPDPYSDPPVLGKALESCEKLARQADIVIVDWELGLRNSSEYAKRIIHTLTNKERGFRFIVILSQNPPESGFPGILDDTFAPIVGAESLWKNKTGQFLLSLRKNNFASTSLFECICSALQNAYPDYLHLAALEIAGRIKEYAPCWLSSIPSNADVGLLVERGNAFADEPDAWHANIQDCVATNLLEDLDSTVLGKDLDSLGHEVLKLSNHPSLTIPSADGSLNEVLSGLKACLRDERPQVFSQRDYKKLFAARDDETARGLVDGIEAYTEFCEVQRMGTPCKKVCPGAIYKDLSADADIAVCISGGCDCLRDKPLLFLSGIELKSVSASGENSEPWFAMLNSNKFKGWKIVLRFQGKAYAFCGRASSLLWKSRAEIDAVNICGVLREDILNRLVSRYMAYIRRVGVNQPTLSRNLRGEKGDDE